MGPDRWQRVRALFERVVDVGASERAAWLLEQCAGDVLLQREVEELLVSDATTGEHIEVLETPPLERVLGAAQAAASLVGTRVGAYRILSVIGSGGMGTVYAAEQDNPRRVVALKLLRFGFHSAAARRRFEYEAEILARLQHPGIAQIHEAGTHGEAAVPFFAMEYVPDARDVMQYAAQEKLDARRKLALLAALCEAVHHGHQKGVIHRDLKPANVLVDATGQPKVIDFGIARCTDAERQTLLTEPGQVIGTLHYMSPEQVSGRADELDVRSDVYALGVLCYQMLSHRLPHDLAGRSLPEAARIIQQEEPPPLGALDRTLRGDVETIVGHAMEKDRDRRYQSARELAQDIDNFLHDQPIQARPASTFYQVRKFAKRHRALVGTLGAVLVLLAAGLIVVSLQNVRIAAENRKAGAVSKFLRDILAEADAVEAKGPAFTVREALDAAAVRVERELGPYPEIEAEIRDVIGATYQNMSLYEQAERHLARAFDIRVRLLGEDDPATLETMNALVILHSDMDHREQAVELGRRCWSLSHSRFGERDPQTLRAAHNLAMVLKQSGQLNEAEQLYRRTLAAREQILGSEDSATLQTMHNLAMLELQRGRRDEGRTLVERVLAIRRRVLGPDHPDTLISLDVLGRVETESGHPEKARPLHAQALAAFEKRLGPDHSDTIAAGMYLARACLLMGDTAAAEPVARTSLERGLRVFGEGHRWAQDAMRLLGMVLCMEGEHDAGEALFRHAFDAAVHAKGIRHQDAQFAGAELARVLEQDGKHEDAVALVRSLR